MTWRKETLFLFVWCSLLEWMLKAKISLVMQGVPSREKNTGTSFFSSCTHTGLGQDGATCTETWGVKGWPTAPKWNKKCWSLYWFSGKDPSLSPSLLHSLKAFGCLPKAVSLPHHRGTWWKPQAGRPQLKVHQDMPRFVALDTLQVQSFMLYPNH